MKNVDLGEPSSFLDPVYLGCTQGEFKTSKDIVYSYRNFSLISCTERMQEQKEENRIVANLWPLAMNLTSSVLASYSSVTSPNASRSPGILKASTRQGWTIRKPGACAIKVPTPTQRRVLNDGDGMLEYSQAQGDL